MSYDISQILAFGETQQLGAVSKPDIHYLLDPNTEQSVSSLALVRPDSIEEVTIASNSYGKFQPRISFKYDNRSLDCGVTDIAWYDFCKNECDPDVYSYEEFEYDYDLNIEYLVLGRSQYFKGSYWPMIVGVVCSESIAEILEAV